MRFLALLLALSAAASAGAYEPLGYPGSTWGTLSRDFNDVEGNGTQGKVQQGVDWFKLPYDWVFDTFGGYSWMARTQQQAYFNEDGPYVGAMFSGGPFTVGADYQWESYPLLRQDIDDFELFGNWYWRKNLGKPTWAGHRALAAPFTTWGRLFDDLNNQVEGAGSMGWIQQGFDWFKLPADVTFETFGAFRWRERSRNEQYYDMFGPAAGIDLIRGPLDLDLEYTWRRYPYIPQSVNGPQLILTWYFEWDLKKLRR